MSGTRLDLLVQPLILPVNRGTDMNLKKPLTFSEHLILSRELRSVQFLTGVEPGAFRPGSDRALFVDVHPFVRYPQILIRQV